ncbi:MAG: MIP/aquaporin family protein [Gemmataceae bacterium]
MPNGILAETKVNKLFAEAFGTFAMVFAGTGAMIINATHGGAITHVGIALTFGLIVMAMIYTVGDVSGAHMNPAVTLGFWAAQQIPGRIVLPYILSQCLGALLASGVLKFLYPAHPTLGATLPSVPVGQAVLIEFILTLLLMVVILSVPTWASAKQPLAGMVIGSVVGLEALFAGPATGASMNPARSLAPALLSGQVQHLWIYIIAPVLGAVTAVPLARLLNHPRSPFKKDIDPT